MRWFIHGTKTTPAVADALVRHKHTVLPLPAEATKPTIAPDAFLSAATKAQADVLTTDAALAEAPFMAGAMFERSIVFLQLEGGDIEQDDAVDRLFARYKRLTPGRLYTVTATRVKIRQLPGQHME